MEQRAESQKEEIAMQENANRNSEGKMPTNTKLLIGILVAAILLVVTVAAMPSIERARNQAAGEAAFGVRR